MSRRTFLVTGATGDTGGATVEQMLARGHHVRALAHRQDDRAKRLQGFGAEVVFGDFLNLDDVRAALRGVAGAYFCYPIRPGIIQATAYFADAARRAGLKAVINMSQISAREDSRSHAARDHWIAERGGGPGSFDCDHSSGPGGPYRPNLHAPWSSRTNPARDRRGNQRRPRWH